VGEPDVSVLLPFYDSRSTLLQAVESVLSNDDEVNFELILIDDGSTDYPEPVLELFRDDARVTVLRPLHCEDGRGRRERRRPPRKAAPAP
jgi:glycosyltransferase involved in cell wall biosynthesis